MEVNQTLEAKEKGSNEPEGRGAFFKRIQAIENKLAVIPELIAESTMHSQKKDELLRLFKGGE